MEQPILQVEHLTKFFSVGPHAEVHAVDDVNFTLRRGRTFGLVGESGCGKSSCARTIIRIYEPSQGKIIFNGQDIAHLKPRQMQPVRRNMQMIFQDPYASLNARMTGRDIIAKRLKSYPHEFSGGMRQRVGIARALVLNPALVICDEPISALDVSIQAQVVNLLRDYQQAEGTSYLFIAHDLSMVRYVSDDIGVMYLGQLVESSDSEEIYKNPLHPYTKGLLSCIPIADPKLARAHASAGVEGDLPSPVNPKPGCRFCGRCPYAKPICSEQTPAMKEAAPGHFVACHLY